MKLSVSHQLRIFADAAWRRRILLMVPFLVLLPLGLAFAKFGPKSYVARSLLLLQESGRDNPLARDAGPVRMQDRIAGLQALLKSDRVLSAAIADLANGEATADAKTLAGSAQDLSSALSLELLGNDFLEFKLKAPHKEGLGRKLEVVTVRFLEALLPAQDVVNVTQLLLDRRKEELDDAERRLNAFGNQIAAHLPPSYGADEAELNSRKIRLAQKQSELASLSAEVEVLRGSVGRTPAQVSALETEQALGRPGQARTTVRDTIDTSDLMKMQAGEARVDALRKEVDQSGRDVDKLQQRLTLAYAPIGRQLENLKSDARKARISYEQVAKNYTPPSKMRSTTILNAPERIKVIDAPRDPEQPTLSALKIMLIAFAASLLSAVGVAVIAELLDPRLRRRDQYEQVAGIPVLARLG
jgi:hypothetical protein